MACLKSFNFTIIRNPIESLARTDDILLHSGFACGWASHRHLVGHCENRVLGQVGVGLDPAGLFSSCLDLYVPHTTRMGSLCHPNPMRSCWTLMIIPNHWSDRG